jgi:hypothetical protein
MIAKREASEFATKSSPTYRTRTRRVSLSRAVGLSIVAGAGGVVAAQVATAGGTETTSGCEAIGIQGQGGTYDSYWGQIGAGFYADSSSTGMYDSGCTTLNERYMEAGNYVQYTSPITGGKYICASNYSSPAYQIVDEPLYWNSCGSILTNTSKTYRNVSAHAAQIYHGSEYIESLRPTTSGSLQGWKVY